MSKPEHRSWRSISSRNLDTGGAVASPGWQENSSPARWNRRPACRACRSTTCWRRWPGGHRARFPLCAEAGRKDCPARSTCPMTWWRAVEKHPGASTARPASIVEGMNGVRARGRGAETWAHRRASLSALVRPAARPRKYYRSTKCELGVRSDQVGQSMVYGRSGSARRGPPICSTASPAIPAEAVGIRVGIPWADEMIAMAEARQCSSAEPTAHSGNFVNFIDSYGGQGPLRDRLPGARLQADDGRSAGPGLRPIRCQFRDNALRYTASAVDRGRSSAHRPALRARCAWSHSKDIPHEFALEPDDRQRGSAGRQSARQVQSVRDDGSSSSITADRGLARPERYRACTRGHHVVVRQLRPS